MPKRAHAEDHEEGDPSGAQPGMQALVRGLRLLDIVAGAPGPMRFSALQEGSGLPKGTLHRIVQTLLDERYLSETEQGYRLGARPFHLAHRVWDAFDLRAAAAPELRRLADSVGESARLGVIEAGQVLYIDQCDAENQVRVGSAVGMRAPVHATALGKAIAAHLGEAARPGVLGADLARLTDATITGVADLGRQLAVIKARGYAVNLGEAHDEVVGVAAPILDHQARPIGAVGIVGPAFRLPEARLHALGREVIEASRRISGNIGELAMSISVNQKPLHVVTGDVTLAVPGSDFLGEGPHWDAGTGRLSWVDILAPALVTADPATGQRTARALPELIGCAIPRIRGGYVCGTETGIRAIGPDGALATLAAPEADRPGNRFNDGKCDSRGRLWLGSLAINTEPGQGALWRFDGAKAVRMLDGLHIANGMGWSPDDRTFYFVDSGPRTIWAFDYDAEAGTISDRRAFATLAVSEGTPDGLAVDAEGGLWVALWDGWAVRRYRADGTLDRDVTLPVPRPTSCAFGGADLSTLYVTSARIRLSAVQLEEAPLSGSLLAVRTGVAGLATHPCAF